MCGLAHEFGHGAAQKDRLQPRSNDDIWTLGSGSAEEPQMDVHTLPWAAGSRMGFSQAGRAPCPCCQPVLPLPSASYLLYERRRLHGSRCAVRTTTHDMVLSYPSPVNAQARTHVGERNGWQCGRPKGTAMSNTSDARKIRRKVAGMTGVRGLTLGSYSAVLCRERSVVPRHLMPVCDQVANRCSRVGIKRVGSRNEEECRMIGSDIECRVGRQAGRLSGRRLPIWVARYIPKYLPR